MFMRFFCVNFFEALILMVLAFWLLSVSIALSTTLFTINHSNPWPLTSSPPFFDSWQRPPFQRWRSLQRPLKSEPYWPFTKLKPGLTIHIIFLLISEKIWRNIHITHFSRCNSQTQKILFTWKWVWSYLNPSSPQLTSKTNTLNAPPSILSRNKGWWI